jgi:uncharacterized protein YecE (DUF72 family)
MTDGSRSDRHIRLALWFLAGTLLPRGASHKGAAPILRQPVRNGGTQWSVLPNAHPDAVKSWKRQTGREFVYAWKASKFITHWKRLSANSVNSLELMEDRLSLLGDKAGPVLFQLPPNFQADADRLSAFLRMLPQERRYSFEFRHHSWYAPRIMRLLAKKNISLCISDHHDAPAPWKRTADFVYVRGHGPGGRYKGHYSAGALADWAKRIKSWKSQGCDVFVFFDNDQKSAAPIDALKLKQLL